MPHRPSQTPTNAPSSSFTPSGVVRTNSTDITSYPPPSTMNTPTAAGRILHSMSQQGPPPQQPQVTGPARTGYFAGGAPSANFQHISGGMLPLRHPQHQPSHQIMGARQPNHSSCSHHQGVVTPIANRLPSGGSGSLINQLASWQSAPVPPLTSAPVRGAIRPGLATPKSADSTDRSTGVASMSSRHDDEMTVASLATEATQDSAARREAMASALLMVSTAAAKEVAAAAAATASGDQAVVTPKRDAKRASPTEDSASGPLKKRKKNMDFLRRKRDLPGSDNKTDPSAQVNESDQEQKQEEQQESNEQFKTPQKESEQHRQHEHECAQVEQGQNPEKARQTSQTEGKLTTQQPFHISPVSNGSVGSHQHRQTQASARTNSYDSKESAFSSPTTTQSLPNSAKIHATTDIALAPPAHVVLPHFPSVLHRVLSDPEYAGSVVQWCDDGESWKVLRWDALRRRVLPVYFADLRDEDGHGCGTIDAFLYHLTAWGFEEINDSSGSGANSGASAYQHGLFIRGAQKLCSKMRFTAGDKGPKAVSPSRSVLMQQVDHSMLQVPSLARPDNDSTPQKAAPGSGGLHNRYSQPNTPVTPHHAMSHHAPIGSNSHGHSPYMHHNWHMRQPMMGSFHPEESSWGSQHSYGYHHQQPHQQQPYHPPFRHETIMRPPYSPPRVRSCRGSSRLSAVPRAPHGSNESSPMQASFSVSNRGKSRRVSMPLRASSPTLSAPSPHQIGASVSQNVSVASADESPTKSAAV